MKGNEWFACISYGALDILIPQSDILESFYAPSEEPLSWEKHAEVFSIDRCVENLFGIRTDSVPTSRMLVKSNEVLVARTGRTPQVIQMDFSTFHICKGVVGKKLFSKGLLAIRFEGNRIQYLVNINALSEASVQVRGGGL